MIPTAITALTLDYASVIPSCSFYCSISLQWLSETRLRSVNAGKPEKNTIRMFLCVVSIMLAWSISHCCICMSSFCVKRPVDWSALSVVVCIVLDLLIYYKLLIDDLQTDRQAQPEISTYKLVHCISKTATYNTLGILHVHEDEKFTESPCNRVETKRVVG